uniref:Uncharacterized protein n=1 Tax=Globodera rostochiensis TaxID=31243 RepID=A0A914IED3_GLORO
MPCHLQRPPNRFHPPDPAPRALIMLPENQSWRFNLIAAVTPAEQGVHDTATNTNSTSSNITKLCREFKRKCIFGSVVKEDENETETIAVQHR